MKKRLGLLIVRMARVPVCISVSRSKGWISVGPGLTGVPVVGRCIGVSPVGSGTSLDLRSGVGPDVGPRVWCGARSRSLHGAKTRFWCQSRARPRVCPVWDQE